MMQDKPPETTPDPTPAVSDQKVETPPADPVAPPKVDEEAKATESVVVEPEKEAEAMSEAKPTEITAPDSKAEQTAPPPAPTPETKKDPEFDAVTGQSLDREEPKKTSAAASEAPKAENEEDPFLQMMRHAAQSANEDAGRVIQVAKDLVDEAKSMSTTAKEDEPELPSPK